MHVTRTDGLLKLKKGMGAKQHEASYCYDFKVELSQFTMMNSSNLPFSLSLIAKAGISAVDTIGPVITN